MKVHLLNEGYTWVLKMRDFTENPNKEISGNQNFSRLGGVLETSFGSSTLQNVGIIPIFVYFLL